MEDHRHPFRSLGKTSSKHLVLLAEYGGVTVVWYKQPTIFIILFNSCIVLNQLSAYWTCSIIYTQR